MDVGPVGVCSGGEGGDFALPFNNWPQKLKWTEQTVLCCFVLFFCTWTKVSKKEKLIQIMTSLNDLLYLRGRALKMP
jgi:hypothetical protein